MRYGSSSGTTRGLMPPSSAKGCSVGLSEEFIQQRFSIEEAEVPSYLCQVKPIGIGAYQSSDILQILRGSFTSPWSLNPISPSGLITRRPPSEVVSSLASASRRSAIGRLAYKKIDPLAAAAIVASIRAAVQALIAEPGEFCIDVVRLFQRNQQIDILSGTNNVMRCQRKAANQSKSCSILQ